MAGRRLGAISDDPREVIAVALDEVKKSKRPLEWRQASEKAYLALKSSLERLAGEPVITERAQVSVLARLGRHSRNLPRAFEELKRTLHGDCFYGAKCSRDEAIAAIGRANGFIDNLPAKLPPKR